jgi:ABC-type multidrug transport system fused ATPase/permease subunit
MLNVSQDNNIQKKYEREPEQEAQQPTLRQRPPFFMEGGKSKLDHPRKKLWKWMFSFLLAYKARIILYTLLMVFGSIINSILPIISKNIIDQGIVPGNWSYVTTWSLFYGIFIIVAGISNYYALIGMGILSQKVVMEIRMKQFSQLQEMSLSYFDARPSGDIISILTNDIDQLNQLVGGQFLQIVTSIITIVLTLTFMFFINPILAGFFRFF